MKILFLVGGSRAGIDLVQSLMDGHPQILQFPGFIRSDEKLTKILSQDNSALIAKNFIKDYPHFFDSRINKTERHDKLGLKMNKFYMVNKDQFIKHFIKKLLNIKIKSKNNFFNKLLALHQAYYLASGKQIKQKKILVINCHQIIFLKYITKKLKNVDYDILHTIRNPLSSISSVINHWLKFNKGKFFFAKDIYGELALIANGIKKLQKITKKIYIIQLEKLHQNHKKVLYDFCKKYNLKFNKCMNESTYFNLKWWGDKISNKKLDGLNKNYIISFNKNYFYKRDLIYLNTILSDLINFYNYKLVVKDKLNINFFPMKCEILTWKNTIHHKKFKHIFSIPFFYLKRIIFINKFSGKYLKLPYSLGKCKPI